MAHEEHYKQYTWKCLSLDEAEISPVLQPLLDDDWIIVHVTMHPAVNPTAKPRALFLLRKAFFNGD